MPDLGQSGLTVLLPAHPDSWWVEADIAGMVGKRLHVDCGHVAVAGIVSFAGKAGEVDEDLMRSSHIEVRASDWAVAWDVPTLRENPDA